MSCTTRGNPQNYRKMSREDLELIEMENDGYPEDTEMTQMMKNQSREKPVTSVML